MTAVPSDFRSIVRRSFALGLVAVGMLACETQPTSSEVELEPDPEPLAPVELIEGSVLGVETFPPGNTEEGGQGEPVGGIGCIDVIAIHYHAHLSLFVEGERIAIPPAVGIVDPVIVDGFVESGGCFYWMHTHDASGLIHIEPPSDDDFTLGELFDVWGRPLTAGNVAGYEGEVSVFVDGERYEGDLREIVFESRQHISLQVGRPLSPPPMYIFQD
jgi:hypothetical protein